MIQINLFTNQRLTYIENKLWLPKGKGGNTLEKFEINRYKPPILHPLTLSVNPSNPRIISNLTTQSKIRLLRHRSAMKTNFPLTPESSKTTLGCF